MMKKVKEWLLDVDMEAFDKELLEKEIEEKKFIKLMKGGHFFTPKYYAK